MANFACDTHFVSTPDISAEQGGSFMFSAELDDESKRAMHTKHKEGDTNNMWT
jgi:hypothetical protein